MTEGRISTWYVAEGTRVSKGDELVDIETEKVANTYESPYSGILRRRLVEEGEALPIGALFGIIASDDVPDAEIDAYVAEVRAAVVTATESGAGGLAPQLVDIAGGCARFLKRGDEGVPIVMIHGFAGDLSSWLLNQDVLAESHIVYALDLPGHGGSRTGEQVTSIREFADFILAFLDAMNLTKAHLIGHSLGGGAVARMAIDHPSRVASLTLLAPVGLGKEIDSEFINGLLRADRRKDMMLVLGRLFHDRGLVSRDMVMNMLKSKRIDGAVDCLRAIAERNFKDGLQTISLRDELSRLPLPVQIIWGASDKIIPSEHSAHLAPSVSVHLIENAGHMVHMEKAAQVNNLTRQLINAS